MKELWLEQRSKLQVLGVTAGLPAQGRRGSLSDALTVAELLVLAPNDEVGRRLNPGRFASYHACVW